jgi:hypothetical protein
MVGSLLPATHTSVITRLDRATPYSATPVIHSSASSYWVTRFRG